MGQPAEKSNYGSSYHDQVIEAAFLHSKPGCYFIGPYARRVSFASQQYRALDLIEALNDKQKIPEQGRVAVIGAGLAGVTAVAALRGLHCKVDLYEAEDRILGRQHQASHRIVHPTISRWPIDPLNLTTAFPFFDWSAAPCDQILELLRAEWQEYFGAEEGANADLRVVRGTRISGLIPKEDGARRVVELQGAAGEALSYDLVIVTTGYGAEKGQEGQLVTSYWTPDDLEDKRSSEAKFVVGGCGDGGLIDTLRLAHNKFCGGWLAFAVAEKLEGSQIAKEIAAAEHDALMMLKSIACMGKKPGETTPDDEPMLRRLYDAYDKAAQDLPPDVKRLLDDSLRDGHDMAGRLMLVSRESYPTVPFSAPIHKLMIVHAIREGRVSWRIGELSISDAGATIVGRGRESQLLDYSVVQRHGASSALKDLLLPDEETTLKLRQFMLADRIDTSRGRNADAPKGYPARNEESLQPAFVGSRHAAAAALIDGLDPRYRIDAEPDGFRYVLASTEVCPPKHSGASLGLKLPTRLFGIIPASVGEPRSYELLA